MGLTKSILCFSLGRHGKTSLGQKTYTVWNHRIEVENHWLSIRTMVIQGAIVHFHDEFREVHPSRCRKERIGQASPGASACI